ncbi:MAG: 5'-methylthioadenosine/S-adenosylhomocysteine nucleosidase/MTA/SAH nucleosidase [Treponematales bacterium]
MTGIIGAMEDEVALLRAAIAGAAVETAGDFEFVRGSLEGRPVALLKCGVGKVSAAAGCAAMLCRYAPSLVINTGSAGGVGAGLTFGDIIIASGLLYHDADVTALGCEPGQMLDCPPVFPVPEEFILLAESALDELKREGLLPGDLRPVRGVVGSGDVFMHECARIEAVRARFPGVRAVEMEGAAIAHTCALFRTPAVIIRSLSDIAGAESPRTFKEFLPVASKNSALLVMRMVRKLGEQSG